MTRLSLARVTLAQLRRGIEHVLADGRRFCLVIDADRTLAPVDSGRLVGRALGVDEDIRRVFETLDYVDDAFTRVAQIWGNLPLHRYNAEIEAVAADIAIHRAWAEVLEAARGFADVVVVTAGIPQVWRSVLARAGHSNVPVIGGCHPSLDEYVVCPASKAEIVQAFQEAGRRVIAAGDSRIDLPMLQRADIALFVPDHKGSPALREQLDRVPGVRHFAVDERRFKGLPTWSAEDLATLIREGVEDAR